MIKKGNIVLLTLMLIVLMLMAGCSQDDNLERLTLTLSYPSGDVQRERSAEIIKEMLAEVGIEVILDMKEINSLAAQVFFEREFDLYLLGWELALEPDPSGIWLSSDIYNSVGFEHPDNDALILDGRGILNQGERYSIYQQWQRLLIDEAPYVWLHAEKEAWAANPRIENFRPDSFALYWDVWDWEAVEGEDQAVIAIWNEPTGLFNDNLAESTYDAHSYTPVFAGLMRNDPRNDYELVPELAQSMEISEDNLTITFVLRDDIYFHDGKKVTAEDVKFTFEWMTHPDYTGAYLSQWIFIEGIEDYYLGTEEEVEGYWAREYEDEEGEVQVSYHAPELTGIEIVDQRTVKFHLSQVDAPSLTSIAIWSISPKHVFEGTEIAELEHHEAITQPIGAGPYKFVRYEEGQFTELVAYENFHRGKPKLERIIVKVAAPETAQAELIAGQTDIAWVRPNASDFALYEENGLKIHDMPANAYQYMGLNLKNSILQDVRVRLAITHAIDRWAMVQNLFDGLAIVQVSHMSSVSWAYDESIQALPFDQEKAAQLLDEAGWELGKDGYRYFVGNDE